MTTTVDKNNNSDNLKAHIRSQVPRESANEHLVPELLFDNPKTTEKEVEGVSAVKAMQIAASKGQKIFTITRANKNKILPLLNHDSGSMQDINQALNAGKEVITHQSRINYKNWTGSGYAIIDPDTGAGAYLISGGANGGLAFGLGLATSSIIFAGITGAFGIGGATFGIATLAPFFLGLLGPLLAFFFIMIAVTLYAQRNNSEFKSCFLGGFAMNTVAFIGVLFPNLGYISGFGAGASLFGTTGSCYGI